MKLLAVAFLVLSMFYINLAARDYNCKLTNIENGNCSVRFERWSYSVSESKCMFIKVGGCHMTVNQFKTKKMCERKCMPQRKRTLDTDIKETVGNEEN
ncbi:trypsin inhibitor-like [Drosophila innubila]|uniref:trypsin inhibitor-like n=1 Tax=Drosophila innubila TaxID=198719 RepID=UPI00148BE84F|nr:trypsin inhibitor-like [Drosophila innubila]